MLDNIEIWIIIFFVAIYIAGFLVALYVAMRIMPPCR